MRIYEARDYNDMSRKAANILSAQVIMKPNCVLGLATGSTPLGIYRQLIDWYQKGDLDFAEVRTVNLDEYCGLAPDNIQSYHYYMQENFFKHINILPENTCLPDGLATDSAAECSRYNRHIHQLGGVDLQLLGLGLNGHIGFNEPGGAFEKETHLVSLTQSTIDANSRFFDRPEDVPKYAYTMGIKSIMQARRILLVACGESKAQILYDIIHGPITPAIPASVLQLHNDVTIVADRAALHVVRERSANPLSTGGSYHDHS